MLVFVLPWALLCLDTSPGQGPVPQQSCSVPEEDSLLSVLSL